MHTLHLTRGTLRINVKADKAAFVTRQVQALQAQGLSHDHKAWYHALRPLRPPSKRIFKPWSRLTLHSSADASLPDRTAIADAKAHFFSAIEAGCAATADELVAHASQRAAEPGPFALADLPSLLQVENLTRRLASSKAPGPSKIPNFFWTLSPVRTAQHLLPLFVKCHVRLSEPMQFKDVDLVTLFKQKGAFSELSNHRAICLLEAPGKLFRKQTRQALLEALPNDDTHQGGMPGSLLQAGQHIVRAYANCARAQGLSHAALFFDVSSAYYRVIRQAFCELGTTDRALITILHRLKVPDAYIEELLGWVQGAKLLQDVSPHLRALVSQMMQATHFQTAGGSCIHETYAGVRPGDAIADVLYSFLQADFLRALRAAADEHQLTYQDALYGSSLEGRLLVPTWADDCVALLSARQPALLLQRLETIAAHAHRLMHVRGMAPNYTQGKTEAMVQFLGVGSLHARRLLHIGQNGRLSFRTSEGVIACHCVPAYSHSALSQCSAQPGIAFLPTPPDPAFSWSV